MSDYEKGFDQGRYSPDSSADFKVGTPQWDGAMQREALDRQRKALDQQSNNLFAQSSPATTYRGVSSGPETGGAGGVLAFLFLLLILGAYVFHGGTTTNNKVNAAIHPGANLRVNSCHFDAVNQVDTHPLKENEWVHVEELHGSQLQVSAYRRPYDGSSVLGSISIECVKVTR